MDSSNVITIVEYLYWFGIPITIAIILLLLPFI